MKFNEISDEKKKEIEWELRNEPDDLKLRQAQLNYGIHFDGKEKPWKIVGNRNHANAIANTLKSRGKNVEVRVTKQPVSEDYDGKIKGVPVEVKKQPNGNFSLKLGGEELGMFASEKAAMQHAAMQVYVPKGSDSHKRSTAQPLAASKKPDPVKKNMDKFHKPKTHKDLKAAQKRGYEKHKKNKLQEGPLVVRGEGQLHNLVDNMLDGWFEAKSRTRDELEKVLNAIGKTITGDADRLVIDNIGKAEDYSINEYTDIPFDQCPSCGGEIFHEAEGKKDACYHKVKSRYKVWPSAYASGALVQCRKKGAKNWGNKSKK